MPKLPSQRTFGAKMTLYQRRCDVITSHRREYDVILTPNVRWDRTCMKKLPLIKSFDTETTENTLSENLAS